MGLFGNWFKKNKKEKTPEIRLSDVEVGDYIYIEYSKFKHKQGIVKVLNNDPENKVIWVEIRWRNVEGDDEEIERLILPYISIHLSNFVLLNSVKVKTIEQLIKPKTKSFEKDINELEDELKIALTNQDFVQASKLRDKIEKLKKGDK